MGQFAAIRRQEIDGFEELQEIVPGTNREMEARVRDPSCWSQTRQRNRS
jgi:hypothetical protein